MTKKSDAPAIRFKGFSDAWEQRKLKELYFQLTERNTDLLPYQKTLSVATMSFKTDGNGAADTSLANYKRLRTGDIAFEGHTSKEFRYGRFVLNDVGDGIMSPRFSALRPLHEMPINFWKYYIHYEPIMRKVLVNSTKAGTMMNELVINDFLQGSILVPSMTEQQAIGRFFKQLDTLITLHQRKFEKLTNVKKSMLEKMFPQNGSSYPEIRFKGFTDPWEQRKVGDLLIERNQQAPMSDEYPLMAFIANEGVAPKGERYDRSALVTDTVNKLYKKTEKGDFIYSSNNLETGSIGLNKYGKACISPVYSIFEPTGIADSDFLGRRLVRKDFINAMVKWRQGVIYGQWRIHESDFLKIEIPVPSVEEQRKIGAYLDQLDNLITLHQRKCVFLFGFFQAFISMIFTASTFSWEQRKLGELVDRVVRKNINNESTLPLTISAQYGLVDQITYFNNRVASRDVSNYYLVLNGEFAYNKSTSDGYPFGAVKRLDLYEKGVLSTLYIVFAPKKEQQIDSDYLTVFFDTDRWHKGVAERAAEGARNHGLLNISAEDFFDIDLSVPKDIVEQKQIGAFIRQLDNLITLHQRECISFTTRAGRLILTANKKRNTSSWEQRKFEEIAVRSSVICSDDTLPRVEYEDIVSGTGRLNKDIYAKQSSKSGIVFHQGDVLYGKLRPYLQNWLLPTFDGLAVGDFWVLQPQNADSSFLYRLIQSRQFDEVANQSTGTKMPRADWKLVSKTVFSIPSNISEQAAIGTYFTALDSLITLHQRKPFLMKLRTSDANRNQTNRLVL